jgi:hypothetical protein
MGRFKQLRKLKFWKKKREKRGKKEDVEALFLGRI